MLEKFKVKVVVSTRVGTSCQALSVERSFPVMFTKRRYDASASTSADFGASVYNLGDSGFRLHAKAGISLKVECLNNNTSSVRSGPSRPCMQLHMPTA
jgi:hypothetical protein